MFYGIHLFLPLQVLAHFDKRSSDLCNVSLDGVVLDGEGGSLDGEGLDGDGASLDLGLGGDGASLDRVGLGGDGASLDREGLDGEWGQPGSSRAGWGWGPAWME